MNGILGVISRLTDQELQEQVKPLTNYSPQKNL